MSVESWPPMAELTIRPGDVLNVYTEDGQSVVVTVVDISGSPDVVPRIRTEWTVVT